MKKIMLFFACMSSCFINADEDQWPIGNFALPVSQQPGPLFSFGQNIIERHDAMGYLNPIYNQGKNEKLVFINELIGLYGLTDYSSILIQLLAPSINKENGLFSSGFGDFLVQGEYAYFTESTKTAVKQATIVAGLYLPTGVLEVERAPSALPHVPFTGLGATAFFLGGTALYTTINWYMFGSAGGIFTTKRKKDNTKLGNTYLYQAGIGRNINHYDDKILLLLFELDGALSIKDKLFGMIDPNSGGSSIFFGPSIFYSTERMIFQAGFQVPVYQKLNGLQKKVSYQISVSVAWLFNHDDYDKGSHFP